MYHRIRPRRFRTHARMLRTRTRLPGPVPVLGVATAACLSIGGHASAQCTPEWDDQFAPSVSGVVHASIVFDDGTGPKLYVAGDFRSAAGLAVNRIACWNGNAWSGLGDGLDNTANALAVFDEDGPGPQRPRLFVGGYFRRAGNANAGWLARWDGHSWSNVGLSLEASSGSPSIRSLHVHDDGTGPALYIGGAFARANGFETPRVARWTGHAWFPAAAGLEGADQSYVADLATFDPDGPGPGSARLYAAGTFSGGGIARLATWNGLAWSAIEGGPFNNPVFALHVFDDGAGAALYAGGEFTTVGSVSASRIARLRNGAWSALGSGFDSPNTAVIYTISDFDPDGSGGSPAALHAGGTFTIAGGNPGRLAARWDGSSWIPLAGADSDAGWAYTLCPFEVQTPCSTSARALYVGGTFSAEQDRIRNLAAWDGSVWHSLEQGGSGGVLASTVWNGGARIFGRPVLVQAGNIISARGLLSRNLVVWDGLEFRTLGNVNGLVRTVIEDDQTGELLIGGDFTSVAGVPASRIARFDGVHWSPVGEGLAATSVTRLAFHDDGTGRKLFAAGGFGADAPGGQVWTVARLDDPLWQRIAYSPTGPGGVSALTTFDDGVGTRLFAGGNFPRINDLPTPCYAAAWDGATWSPIGESSSVIGAITAFLPFDMGNGTQLIAGGGNGVCIWNGSQWLRLGGSIHGGAPAVRAISIADPDLEDSAPPTILLGGTFASLAQVGDPPPPTLPAAGLALWDGVNWKPLSSIGGSSYSCASFASFDDDHVGGAPPALYVSGQFSSVDAIGSANIARFGCAAEENILFFHQPDDAIAAPGATVVFHAGITALGAHHCSWRRNGAPLVDGPAPGGGVISGARTPTLRIDGVNYEDQGWYDLVVDRRCDNASSGTATLNVRCPADFNDDDVVDFFDCLDFVSAFEAGDDAADFNHDSVVDFFDYLDFMAAFISAC